MTNSPEYPVVIPATPSMAQITAVARDIGIVASALPALIAVIGTHNVQQITSYVTGSAFAPALGVISLVGIIIWRQLITRKQSANDIKMAQATPDSIAVVKVK